MKKIPKVLKRKQLPRETRERIASYLDSHGMKNLAKKVLKGEFLPDPIKWEERISEYKKRKKNNIFEFDRKKTKLISDFDKRKREFYSELEEMHRTINKNIDHKDNNNELSDEIFDSTISHQQLYEKSNIIELKQLIMDKLETIDFKRASKNLNLYKNDIKSFIHTKWKDINSIKRKFALSKDKLYPVEVSVSVLKKIGIDKFQFDQSDFIPPEVGIDFIMKFGVNFHCSIDGNGNLRIQRELRNLFPNKYQLLFNLAVIVYYADLIIPGNRNVFKSNSPEFLTGGKKKKYGDPKKKKKYIPRLINSSNINNVSEATVSSDEYSIFVDPFRRKLPVGQKPSFEKIVEADQFGINLQGIGYPEIQYTFVKGHIRGDNDEISNYSYEHDYKAVKTFETILSLIGFNL